MREWGAKHPELAFTLAVLAGGVVAVTVDLLLGQELDTTIANMAFFMLFVGGGLYFTQKRLRKTKARLDEQGQSLLFLRYPNSLPGSLSGVWQMGIATPAPGRIDFQPAVYDELIPSGRSRTLTGLRSTGLPPRLATHNDNKQAVPGGYQIITLESDGGVIDIAASPATLQKMQDAVEPASP
ncbi:hypothetical protein LFT44_08350 [Arthrobacter sp. FW306-05-C]|uniref:hypothetical protein n=1 Tax=Arthrobacter sp. FW306-05-C TaxID=2879620 RepID=UPI001F31E9BB|nr:hypothetical protein [Arthrobacter sp. FW306-05-C]UKA68381.1 hypothetical protein LFT44_08350 [Arthrobacter sp. FW306-05-C]